MYQWNTGANSSSITVNSIGSYAVTVTDENGCKGSDSTAINHINPLPAAYLPPDTAMCSYGTLALRSTAPFSSYLWSTGGRSSSITVSAPAVYWLEVVDINGCKGRDSVLVLPKQCLTGFYIPTAFTPNGDGKNDVFRPLLFGNVKQYSFTVYNRWGQVVYQTAELQKGWNGKVAGMPQRSDAFVWICTYEMEGDGQKTEKGTVTLIR